MPDLARIRAFMDRTLPVLIWLIGVVFIVDVVFQVAYLPEIAEYPRALFFLTGLALWIAGDTARKAQKRAPPTDDT